MKDYKQNARRWLREAHNTLKQAQHSFESKDYNLVCFLTEQAAQKALKAVLYRDETRFVTIHSITELIKKIAVTRTEFLEILDRGTKLDQYYLSSRYPDAVPEPAIPSEIFIKEQAEEAMSIARTIFNVSASTIEK